MGLENQKFAILPDRSAELISKALDLEPNDWWDPNV